MNICFIGPQVMRQVSGGAWIQCRHTAEALRAHGHQVTFFDMWHEYLWDSFDIVHLFRADFETVNIARWLYERRIPFVVSPIFFNRHPASFIRFSLFVSHLVQKLYVGVRTDFDYIRTICDYSTRVLPNTIAEGALIGKGMGIDSGKIVHIPNAVEARFAHADPSLFTTTYGIRDFILSVANFGYSRKNMLRLIQALRRIDHPSVLIGTIYDNEYGAACRREMEKAKHILWIDSCAHDAPMLASAYAACKVFVLPSEFETPGLAALEAALAGAVVVITPYGGTREYFGTMAHYVDPYRVESIASQLTKALSNTPDPVLKKHVRQHFTWEPVVDKILNVYAAILSKNR